MLVNKIKVIIILIPLELLHHLLHLPFIAPLATVPLD
jgi:hypothetical protein